MKALIVGLGFGQAVYKPILSKLGYEICTVDLKDGANYTNVDHAVRDHGKFDIVHICTPNYTHENLARQVAPYADIIFVEKPGVINHTAWHNLIKDFDARVMMVKNNQYRAEIDEFKRLAKESNAVNIRWDSKNRIPQPGSWFTTKNLAFGGVSRDLIPHMLSYFTALTDYIASTKNYVLAHQQYTLSDIDDTDYGVVNKDGIYNVDDFCSFEFVDTENTNWMLTANWKNNKEDDSSISFHLKDGNILKFNLGLCPEEAYEKMIKTAVENLNNDKFWKSQYEQDMWIHRQIEQI